MTLLDSTANGYVYNGVGWVGVTPMGNRLTTLKTELSAQKSNIDNAFSNANTGFLVFLYLNKGNRWTSYENQKCSYKDCQ